MKWNPPKDNGGAPIHNYVIEKFDEERGTWARVGSANEMATEFVVPNLNEGQEYKFRVSAENVHGHGEPAESKSIVCKNPFGSYSLLILNTEVSGYNERLGTTELIHYKRNSL